MTKLGGGAGGEVNKGVGIPISSSSKVKYQKIEIIYFPMKL